jgi:hypothetical protein
MLVNTTYLCSRSGRLRASKVGVVKNITVHFLIIAVFAIVGNNPKRLKDTNHFINRQLPPSMETQPTCTWCEVCNGDCSCSGNPKLTLLMRWFWDHQIWKEAHYWLRQCDQGWVANVMDPNDITSRCPLQVWIWMMYSRQHILHRPTNERTTVMSKYTSNDRIVLDIDVQGLWQN